MEPIRSWAREGSRRLNRTADRHVFLGKDIPNAAVLYAELSRLTNVNLFFVEEQQIAAVAEQIPDCVQPIKGSIKLHQICLTCTRGEVAVRNLSCFCLFPEPCSCYDIRTVRIDPTISHTPVVPLVLNHPTPTQSDEEGGIQCEYVLRHLQNKFVYHLEKSSHRPHLTY